MDMSPTSRPLSQPRPTQAYYVPRRLLENGRGPTVGDEKEDSKSRRSDEYRSPKNDGAKSPRETPESCQKDKENRHSPKQNKNRSEPRRATESGRNEQKTSRRDGEQPRSVRTSPRSSTIEVSPKSDSLKENRRGRVSPPQSRPQSLKTKPEITTSEPRVVATQKTVLSRPNAFCPISPPEKNKCICNRPEGHVVCKRCGYESSGRVQVVCGDHPNKLSLMDLRECPNPICRSIQIVEITSGNQ